MRVGPPGSKFSDNFKDWGLKPPAPGSAGLMVLTVPGTETSEVLMGSRGPIGFDRFIARRSNRSTSHKLYQIGLWSHYRDRSQLVYFIPTKQQNAMAALTCLESFTWLIIIRGINPVVLHWTWISGAPATWSPSLTRYEACPSVSRPAHSSPYWSHSLVSGDTRLRNPF